jgi:hypothetical protein
VTGHSAVKFLTLGHFRRHFPVIVGQHYLADRFGEDITNDPGSNPITHRQTGSTSPSISGITGSATTR